MAQHDYNIANQSGADFRADLNNALLAIATVNSGSTEPSTTFAHQLWVDTSSSVLKIRNAADNAWITTGVSITASNTFTGNLTGDVTGNLTGNVTGNVTGDLTGNAVSSDTLSTARTISLSGDVVGSVSFDGSANVDIDTVVQINSITLGTDTTGDYVESMSGGTGVTVTGGTGEGSTPSIAIGQAVAATDDVTFNIITATEEFIGDLEGGIRFNAKADGALSKGDVVYISGVSGDVPTVGQAKADDASKMPAFGLALSDANDNAALQVVTFGTIEELDTSGVSEGQILYVSTTAGAYTTTAPTGESSQIQNIGKVIRSHAAAGSIKVGGAGRSNATPNLDNGKIFIGNGSNQAVTSTLDTSIVVENTNLYYTQARFDTAFGNKDTDDLSEGTTNLYYTSTRANTDFDTRLATKDTGDLSEGTNLYYTTARVNSAFDTRLATKSTSDLAEGTNLYYTTTRFDSAFNNKDTDDLSEGTTNLYYTDARANSAIDARVTKAFVDALNVQAASVDANSVALGTDTTGNYVATITGTANKISVSGSGSESADITLSLPDDVQIASDLTVAGNLTVNGTLTSLDTTNLDIEDNLFQLNAGLTGSPVNDSGMLINRGTADNGIFMWDESVDKFTLGLTTADGSATGNITLNSLGTLVANIEGAVTGNVTGTVSSISNHSTSDLSEGTNLYYTDARFDTRLATKDTDDVSEGSTNLYYTTARFNSAFSGKSTSDLSEGSNLYYTDARVQAISINNVVEDTTPQLGSNLDLNSSDITGTGDINITGTVTADGLTVDGDASISSANARLRLFETDTTNLNTQFQNQAGDFFIKTIPDDASSSTSRFGIDHATGDISFYEDTGTTAKLFWDASAESLGIGTTSPSHELEIHSASPTVEWSDSDNNYRSLITQSGSAFYFDADAGAGGSSSMRFRINGGTEAVRIDSSGNLLVGTTSAYGTTGTTINAAGLVYSSADGDRAGQFDRTTSDGELVRFSKAGTTVGSIGIESGGFYIDGESGHSGLSFGGNSVVARDNGTRVDNTVDLGSTVHRFKDLHLSGTAYINTAVGIGTTSPQTDLNIVNTSGATLDINTNLVGADSKILLHEGSSSSPANGASIRYDGANNLFKIGVGSSVDTTRLTIARDTGNVGIGASSALDNKLEVNGGDIRVRGTSTPSIKFNNADQEVVAMRLQSGATGNLSFHTDKMVIDVSGNLLVGQTTASSGTVGTSLRADGRTFFCADNNYAAHFNRNTSDGAIVHFAKDDSIVGSIGVVGGDVAIYSTASSHAGLRFAINTYLPTNNAGAVVDATTDFGTGAYRYKDLHLSGDANLSGIIQNAGQPTASNGQFVHFNTGSNTVSSNNTSTVTLLTRSPNAEVASTGTCYLAGENSGGSIQFGVIIDFFYSNGTLQTTARETGSSQGTVSVSIAESGNNLAITVTYAGGLGGAIRYTAAGHAVNSSY
jgi:hypothetical protein